jgi:hypothetical protein
MRLLSLSHPIRDPLIDNHSIFNAPTIFDYEAIVVDPGAVTESIREAASGETAFETHASVPVANGSTIDGVAGIADVLNRRRDEFTRALERGAAVAVFGYPVTRVTGIAGFPTADNYFYLPAPDGLAWDDRLIRGGEGATAAVVDHDHPFAPVVDLVRPDLLYRAYFDDRTPGFAKAAKVFARSPGGAPVGVQFRVLNGHVVFLPSPRQAGASWLAGPEGAAMLTAMRDLLARPNEDRPAWIRQVDVPGLAALEQEREEAERAVAAAEEARAEAVAATAELESVREMLWQTGDGGLLPRVVRCLELLGFEHELSPDGNAVLSAAEGVVHLVVGGSIERVDMTPHYRLRQRLDTLLERSAVAGRGLIVANGRRLNPPTNREDQYTDSLRVGAEALGYAVLTASALLDAAIAALDGAAEEALASARRRIVETDGVVELDDLWSDEGGAEPD